MPNLQQAQDVVGTSATDGAAIAGRVAADGRSGPAAEMGSRPLWASLLQPGSANAIEDGPAAIAKEETASPARAAVPPLSGTQADRLLASLKGVALSGGPGNAPGPGLTPVAAGAPRASSNGPARSTQRPADGTALKAGDPSGAVPSRTVEAKDAPGAAPAVPRDPRSDDILPTARKRAFSFRLR